MISKSDRMTQLPHMFLIAILILLAFATITTAMPPVPYFNQCDPQWSTDQLGGDGPTICAQGCALTSAAMVMAYYGVDTDPQTLNNAIGRSGYDATYCIYWSAVVNACHDETNRIEYSPGKVEPFNETILNTYLDAEHPVIVEVYCPGYGNYWGRHFVVVTGRSDGTYYINDPASSTRSTLDDYPTRYGMRIFTGNPPTINKPLVGDWNGNGTDTTGIYNYTMAEFILDSGSIINFGISSDIPITGDWDGDGYDTIGVFRPSTAQFFLDYNNDGVADMDTTFGVIGDIPVAGDWDGDGDDNIGVFRANHSDTGLTTFFLDLDNSGGVADLTVAFGEPDDLPVIGDWDGDRDDNIGLYRSGSDSGVFYLDLDNDGGSADLVTPEYGDVGDIPVAGDWDGDEDDNIGVYRPGTGEFFMDAEVPDVSGSETVDEVNVTLVGQFGGSIFASDISGDYLFIGQGQDFVVLDFTDPAALVEVGRVSTDGLIREITVSGNYAYIAYWSNCFVTVDISNPELPVLWHYNIDIGGPIMSITVSGDYAYIANGNNGLVILDISNPELPVLAGHNDTVGFAKGVTVSGNYAYIADGDNGLVILDISNPESPVLTGHYDTAGSAYDVTVSGDYVYIADQFNGLMILNISNPESPVLTGHYGGYADSVTVSRDYAYVTCGIHGIRILDISNPDSPVLTKHYDTPGFAECVIVSGDYAYIAARCDLVILDISNPDSPVFAGHYKTVGSANCVTISGDYAYIADSCGLVILDISNPDSPVLAGHYDTAGWACGGVTVSGDYAYIANGRNGLVILDISNPEAPVLTGQYDTEGCAMDVTVSGDYAYIADYNNGLMILDIRNPEVPLLTGHYDTVGRALGVTVSGDYAYMADSHNGLMILDITNPESPVLTGQYDTEGYAMGVTVSGDYAYIADDHNGLVILDITNPDSPILTRHYDTAGFAKDVLVSEDYAYIADGCNDLVILDISNPELPILVGYYYDIAGYAMSVTVSENHAYVVNLNNGLVILRITVSATDPHVHNINKGTNYFTIQAAINDADPGDEIHVDAGTYINSINVNKQLTLIGKGTDVAIMQVMDASDHALEVTADYVNISGFTVTKVTGCYKIGIYLNNVDHCNIFNNNASNNLYGICLSSSSNNTLTNNTANSNYHFGIYLYDSYINTLTNNIASNNLYGIYLHSASSNIIYNNYFNNTINAFDSGNNIWNTTHTAITNIAGGSCLGGNYWSDYSGIDTDGDGLGDTLIPYNSSGDISNGGDYHPLIHIGSLFNIDPVISPTTINYQTITGTRENDVNISVTCPTATVGLVDYPTDTTWFIEITNLTQGENIITVTASNIAGNTATINVTIDYDISETAGNETISISSTIVDVNDTIIMPITIANASNIQQVTLDLIYNPDVATILNITANDSISSSTITYTLETGKAAIELTNPENITVTDTTLLIDISFQAGENTGTTALELRNVKLTDNTGFHAPDTIINGSITVCIKGDFNNNNRVDIGDAAKVAFMVAGKVSEDPRADFNNNGRVDVGDAAKISFYLAQKVSEL